MAHDEVDSVTGELRRLLSEEVAGDQISDELVARLLGLLTVERAVNSCLGGADVLREIEIECTRSMENHGPLRSMHEAYAVILEELDEVWDLVKLNPAKMTACDRDAWKADLRKELTHTAAMCMRARIDLGL